jgi:TPR repeat protein
VLSRLAVTQAEADKDPLEPLWNKAHEAAARADYPGLLYVWKALADKGVWQIYARIGELYERGAEGIERNLEEALHWYRRAVFEADDPVAHVGLGRAYYTGVGAPRDFALAAQHFEKAYAHGLPDAALYLGIMHYGGIGVNRDPSRAQGYFEVAATAEYFYAYFKLARIALDNGRIIRAIRLSLKGWLLGLRISKEDRNDHRLLGVERSGS